MGLLIDGVWQDQWYDTKDTGGAFKRSVAQFRNWITEDGRAGETGEGGFQAESGRYHLYVSLACPWAHRTLIFRALKSLKTHISVDIVHPLMLENGWTFETDSAATGDRLYGSEFLYQIYNKTAPNLTTRVTVPVLWDKERETIVSNESSEIIRMFNSAFNSITGNSEDYDPQDKREVIEQWNREIYSNVNNGVYKAGFATTQSAYETAVRPLFASLDKLDAHLANERFLAGDEITEADIRLFTTLIRFDHVYHGHFKCNHKRLVDYENLFDFTRAIYQLDGVAETVNIDHITRHYYQSHVMINPTQIVPVGPVIDWNAPTKR